MISKGGTVGVMLERARFGSLKEKAQNYTNDVSRLVDIIESLEALLEEDKARAQATETQIQSEKALHEMQEVLEKYGLHRKYIPSAE